MSDITPEMAFLQSLQAEQPPPPPTAQLHAPSAEDVSSSASSTSDEDAEAAEDEDEDDDYDPSALVTPAMATEQAETHATPNGAAPKPSRTKGGFLVEDDSDEENENTSALGANGLNGGIASTDAQRSSTATPLNVTGSADVQVSNTENSSTHLNNPSLNLSAHTASNLGVSPTPTPKPLPPTAVKSSARTQSTSALPKVRLPMDTVGILEDRIAEDERGDIDAWLELINEHRSKNRLDDARAVYERYFKLFPSAADQWVQYAQMELENEQFYKVESIFSKSLLSIPNVRLWSMYLDYIRRRNNLISDATGTARQVISQAYEFVLNNVGIDKDAGFIWKEYIQFLRSGPGTPGGNDWRDQQKMDSLRKAYRQAIVIPNQELESVWRDYYAFETQLNPVTGRKFIQEQSPGYYTAKQCVVQLDNLTKGLIRSTTPKLAPLPGFDGDEEHAQQLHIWNNWIGWEKDDHLVLKTDDAAQYRRRIIHVYKQATMTMRFEPQFWYEAAQFCFDNDMDSEGMTFLESGIHANPESCLLAFKHADRIEVTTVKEDGQEALKRRGEQVKAPYMKVLDALYRLITISNTREETAIARIQENFAQRIADTVTNDENEEEKQAAQKSLAEAQEAQIKAIQAGSKAQVMLLKKTISFSWIAVMRAMRRVQGKGKIGDPVGGLRQMFHDARKRGQLTSDVFIASALLEHFCYKDPAATKIFQRGASLFQTDENFAMEYLKHLIEINDSTNARAVFETSVNKLTQNPETAYKAKPFYLFFHHYEANYGELDQVVKLEQRMKELFPNDNIDLFANRFRTTIPHVQLFDPTTVRPIISIKAQTRPKALPSIEKPQSPVPQASASPAPFSPRPANAHLTLTDQSQGRFSPKRPFLPDPTNEDLAPPRKVARGESPFKGAAGRRVNAAKGGQTATPALPRDVTIFLSILPRPELASRLPALNNGALMTLLRHVNLTQVQHQAPSMQRVGSGQGFQPAAHYGYPPR